MAICPRPARCRLLLLLVTLALLSTLCLRAVYIGRWTVEHHVYPRIRFRSRQTPSTWGTIPKIIHQTWRTEEVAMTFEPWVRSWVTHHADWEYWFWTDSDIHRLVSLSFPHLIHLYENYPGPGYRADMFRYLALYDHGGVYADLDMESLRPIEASLEHSDCFLSQEPEEHAHFLSSVGVPLVSNALMGCRPRHPFFRAIIDGLPSRTGWFQWAGVLDSTGPHVLTEIFRQYNTTHGYGTGGHVVLTTSELFQPLIDNSMLDAMRAKCHQKDRYHVFRSSIYEHHQKRLCTRLMRRSLLDRAPSQSFAVHHFTHTWAGPRYDPWGLYNSRQSFQVRSLLQSEQKKHPT